MSSRRMPWTAIAVAVVIVLIGMREEGAAATRRSLRHLRRQ